MLPKHKIPPPIIAIICAFLMWWLAPSTPTFELNPIIQYSLITLFIGLGLIFDFSALYVFRKAKTTINPMAPERASALVINGIYRFSRNPMYVGLLFFLFAWAVFLQSIASMGILIVFVIMITYLQIKPEETVLEKHFGDTFTEYKKRVRRWL